jgi:predicted nuclease with TOPRIM domain
MSSHSDADERAAKAVGGKVQHILSEIEGPPYRTDGEVLEEIEGDSYVSGYKILTGSESASEMRVRQEDEDKDLQVERMKAEIKKLERKLEDTAQSTKSFNAQQKKLNEGFKVLRMKYDDLKADTAELMWEYIPKKVSLSLFFGLEASPRDLYTSPHTHTNTYGLTRVPPDQGFRRSRRD